MDNGRLLQVLADPSQMAGLTLEDWDRLLPAARATMLMPWLATRAGQLDIDRDVPPPVRWHLRASQVLADRYGVQARQEVREVARAIADLDVPCVLLKGAAYLMADLEVARGRMLTDIDVLVPRERLAEVERALYAAGWETADLDERQQRYFRRWLHEIPALVHPKRGSKLDVHHNILPATDALSGDANLLLQQVVPLPGGGNLYTLSPADMVLHCAAHLFRQGHYETGLRDLVDLDGLLRWAGSQPGFWETLTDRAAQLRLGEPLYFSLRYVVRFLGTPLPEDLIGRVGRFQPRWPPLPVMDRLVWRAIMPPRLDGRNAGRQVALALLGRYPLSLMRRSILPKLERVFLPADDTSRPGLP